MSQTKLFLNIKQGICANGGFHGKAPCITINSRCCQGAVAFVCREQATNAQLHQQLVEARLIWGLEVGKAANLDDNDHQPLCIRMALELDPHLLTSVWAAFSY